MDRVLDQVEVLSKEVVCRSVEEIHGRLDARAKRMSVAEARGYVRARARRVVQKHTALVAAEKGGCSLRAIRLVSNRALERATHRVVRELWTIPRAQFGLRVAG